MARTKEFDPDTALRAALELFWQRGYEATSMADLVAHLGIGRASIYATFGNKHDLYLKALDLYIRSQNPLPMALLDRPGPALPAVRALVRHYADDSARDRRRRGCLVVNAAIERAPDDDVVARRVGASWDALEAALTSALTRARTQGELSADKDPRALARFLLVVLQGLRVLGRGRAPATRLREGAEQALAILD